jgi:hypothetical protein
MVDKNQPKHRHHERKPGDRASCDRILIVCEGSKTEPNYFKEIRAAYHLREDVVVILSSTTGTDSIQVVECAKEIFESGIPAKIRPGKPIPPLYFEQIFAVFDRDDHESYSNALRKAASLDGKLKNKQKQPVSFKAIPSVPCFELWLLLHYKDVQAPLHRKEVMKRLKRHFPDYDKGAKGVFAYTSDGLDIAMKRAEILAERFAPDTTEQDPYTAVFKLVTTLRKAKNSVKAISPPPQAQNTPPSKK